MNSVARRWLSLLIWLLLTQGFAVLPNALMAAPPTARLVDVQKVWDAAPHSAFTDLLRYRDRWYLVFREASSHLATDGVLRLLSSGDGARWETAAVIRSTAGGDLRDPKLSVTPQGELMLMAADVSKQGERRMHDSLVWFSTDGRKWSAPRKVGDANVWMWRVVWKGNEGFGFGYGSGAERFARLYRTTDGKSFQPVAERMLDVGEPNEASAVFDGDTMYCLMRREQGSALGLLGISQPPYTKWIWRNLSARIGGPHLLRLDDGRLLAATRLHDKKVRTSLCWVDPDSGQLTECLALPSGGDTSYAGLALHAGLVWVSYYSTHEGKTSIYLAKVEIPPQVRDIGARRELFVDKYLLERMQGVTLKLHEPRLATPSSQPADNLEYGTIINDGDLFRLYTRDDRGAKRDGDPRELTRYAESRDGIHWTKPKLGLVEVEGTKENNVILQEAPLSHNFTPFLDTRPGVPANERFKALAGTVESQGLVALVSGDGIHWRKLRKEPVIRYTKEYAFDSQNIAFWAPEENGYVCYFRHFLDKKQRSVARTTSKDFIHWTEAEPLRPNLLDEQLYTSQTSPYFRAPHIRVAMPTRFLEQRGNSTDILFMSTRAGQRFNRTFVEVFLRPGMGSERWGNRANYAALNVFPTGPAEMSFYATPFRRFTLRTDGFASLHAGGVEGEALTHRLRFSGKQLLVNYSTSAAGSVRFELQDDQGQPLPGFALADCRPLVGDAITQGVVWGPASGKPSDLSQLAGRTVRLRIVLADADLYSIQFAN